MPINVLYIEDEPIHQQVMAICLRGLDINIHFASRGTDGITIAQTLRPGIIFMDTNLPDIEGGLLLRLLKEDKRSSDIPVVIVTSDLLIQEKMDLWKGEAAASACIFKPINRVKLVHIIAQVVDLPLS